jgi:hypothetical protein
VVVADSFPVRGAKRLFGLISAGGTAGAMTMGLSLSWLTDRIDLIWLIPLLIVLVILFFLVQAAMPRSRDSSHEADDVKPEWISPRGNIQLIWNSPHLRTIALIVFIATAATTLIDYQFKELARAQYPSQADLTGFFGAFYGWTGGIALVVQLLVAGRIMASTGIAAGLAVTPMLVLMGSAGVLLAPGLLLIMMVRGADYSLRKSLFRPMVELLYVPLPSLLRRRTKTFVDSVVDSLAEGFGAAMVFFWVTLPGLPSRFLSLFVILFAALFIYLSGRMGRQYFATIVQRLKEEADAERLGEFSSSPARDLLSGTFTRVNITPILEELGMADGEDSSVAATADEKGEVSRPDDIFARLKSPHEQNVLAALREFKAWDAEHVPDLTRLLARDSLYDQVVAVLRGLGEAALPHLVGILCSEDADFVIRRRIPAILAGTGGPAADDALLDVLTGDRFEVRYRAALALVRRRKAGLPPSQREWRARVWHAIRLEVKRERPLWELQKLLDGFDNPDDDLVVKRVGVRGELSLEHTFRMLTLVLEPQPVRAAFQGIILEDEHLKSFALEYLERVLPPAIRRRLWLFIGDVSEYKKQKEMRSLDEVVSDLISTRATLFAGDKTRDALKRMLEESEE